MAPTVRFSENSEFILYKEYENSEFLLSKTSKMYDLDELLLDTKLKTELSVAHFDYRCVNL